MCDSTECMEVGYSYLYIHTQDNTCIAVQSYIIIVLARVFSLYVLYALGVRDAVVVYRSISLGFSLGTNVTSVITMKRLVCVCVCVCVRVCVCACMCVINLIRY